MMRVANAFDTISELFKETFGPFKNWPSEIRAALHVLDSAFDFAFLARKIGVTQRVAYVVYKAAGEYFFGELTEEEKRQFVAFWQAWWVEEFGLDLNELFKFLPEAKDYL